MKVGDKLTLTRKAARLFYVHEDQREATIIEINGISSDSFSGALEIISDGAPVKFSGNFSYDSFYLKDNINDIIRSILDGETEFASFVGVTIDGKEINISRKDINSDETFSD